MTGAKHNLLPCDCCGAHTISVRGGYEICPRCGWEDDPVQARDPGFRGGANAVSLEEARAAWRARGE
ncbi:MAG: CPCC family cysteine-rich protein [Rhizomicrobium sp.]